MSTGEKLNIFGEFLVKSNASASEIVDDIDDILWRLEGGTTAINDSIGTCPGGKEVTKCDTGKALAQSLLKHAYGIEAPGTDESAEDLGVTHELRNKNQHAVSAICQTCDSECHAITRVSQNDQSNERIRFQFKSTAEQNEAEKPPQEPPTRQSRNSGPIYLNGFEGA